MIAVPEAVARQQKVAEYAGTQACNELLCQVQRVLGGSGRNRHDKQGR